jgi:D-alanyl-D-alanine-carboxypeptidase/D-alanyl-D-alanine-endopeptidase
MITTFARTLRTALPALALLALGGCGEDGGQAPPTVTAPPAPSPAAPDFAAVRGRMDQFTIPNVALIVGDRSGTLLRYERGTMTTARPLFIASASKLLLGVTAWRMVEDRRLAPDTRASSLIDFWSSAPADPRSAVTFGQLFAFTSGFNRTAEQQQGCIGDPGFTLRDCVKQIHDDGPDSPPGQSFNYGNEHMQIAALAMTVREGKSVDAIMRERLLAPLGVSAETRYTLGAGDNPTYSGGMRSNGEDYARVLAAILRGDVIADRTGFLADRVATRPVATVPPAISGNGLAWRYGWGFWKECEGPAYVPACDAAPIISSAGAFGFTPWIDFGKDYWAIIILEEPLNQGFDPAQRAIALEQELQPLIAAALRR